MKLGGPEPKTMGLFLNPVDEHVVALELVGRARGSLFAALLELRHVKGGRGPEPADLERSAVGYLSASALTSGASFIVVSCVDGRGLSTYVAVVGREREQVLRGAELACATLLTLGSGRLHCAVLRSGEALEIAKRCLVPGGLAQPLAALLRRSGGREAPVLHPIPAAYGVPSLDPREYEAVVEALSQGTIPIGHLYSNPNIVVKLRDEHVLRHIAIVGSTGSGKSTTASIIAAKAARSGYAVLVVDWHGEYRGLLGGCEGVAYTNIAEGSIPEALDLEALLAREPLAFVEILESALELTPAQAHILEEALSAVGQRRFHGSLFVVDLVTEVVANSPAAARWYAESREALLRKLKPLTSRYLGVEWGSLKRVKLERGSVTIFDVSAIPNTRVKRVLSSLLVRSVTLKAQHGEAPSPLMIVVDEAHNLFAAESPISNLVAEVRKWGVGFVVATQAPSMIAPVVLKNVNTKIVHTLKSSTDVKAVLSALVLGREYKKAIASLRPGEALLSLPDLPRPVLVKIASIDQ